METHTLNDLAEQFVSEVGSDSYSQFAKILGLLANGRPVAVDEVAKELDMYPEQAKKFLTRYGAEFDSAGNLLGLGLTLVPTPHHFEVDGHQLYAWCATDTLLFPILLNKTANVETIDPVTGTKIRLTVSPRAVERVEPRGAVLSFSNYLDAADVRGTFCNIGHWFASRQAGEEYASKHKGAIILTPEEVRDVLNVVTEKATGRPEQEDLRCGAGSESKAPGCH
jgi:alkylmercury lyase